MTVRRLDVSIKVLEPIAYHKDIDRKEISDLAHQRISAVYQKNNQG
jgi:chromosome segregation and condensation protein ScpB